MGEKKVYDALIVGGGPAGLSAATTLALQLHKSIVFDSGTYRNRIASTLHMVAGWEEKSPVEFRTSLREGLLKYGHTTFCDLEVLKAAKINDRLFEVTDAQGQVWVGYKLILATGVEQVWPDIAGYQDGWGRWLSGWERQSSETCGVLGIMPLHTAGAALQMAHLARRLCKTVTIYTNGDEALRDDIRAKLKGASDYRVDARKVVRLSKPGDKVLVEFEEGPTDTHDVMTHMPLTHPAGPFKEQLGLEVTMMGDYKTVTGFQETPVKGVYATGDCSTMFKVISFAIANGNLTGSGVINALHEEELGLEPFLMG